MAVCTIHHTLGTYMSIAFDFRCVKLVFVADRLTFSLRLVYLFIRLPYYSLTQL